MDVQNKIPVFVNLKRGKGFNNEEMIAKYRETHDPKIKEEIILINIPLAMSIMKDYAYTLNSKTYYPDLISVAYLTLIESVDKYDPTKAKFSTYVTMAINQNVNKEIFIQEGENNGIRYGRKIAKYRYMAASIFGTSDVIYDEKNMDYVLGIMLEKKIINKNDLLPMRLTLHSVSKLATDEEIENVPEEIDTSSSEPIEFIRTYHDELFAGFNDYEKKVIEYRYGFIDGKEHSFEEVGKYFGRSRQAIHQQEKKLLRKMYIRVKNYR